MLVIDKTLSNFNDDLERKKWIRGADILISALISIYIIGCFYYGFQGDGDYGLITNGLFFFVILGISVSLILVKKLDPEFLRNDENRIDYKDLDEKVTPLTDMQKVFGLISGSFAFMTSIKGALLHIISVEIIVLIILSCLRLNGSITADQFSSYSKQYCLVYIPVCVSLFIFLSKP